MQDNIPMYLNKLKEEVKAFHNFYVIMEKAEKDGYVNIFLKNLQDIFANEMKYAIGELTKMKKK